MGKQGTSDDNRTPEKNPYLDELPEAFRDISLDKADGLVSGHDPEEGSEPTDDHEEIDDENSEETTEEDESVEEEEVATDGEQDEPGEESGEEQSDLEEEEETEEEEGSEESGDEEQEEEEEPILLTLKYNGKDIPIADTEEGKEHLINLAQKGVDYSVKMNQIKPWAKYIDYLYQNPDIRSQVEARMRGEDVIITPSEQEMPEDYTPSDQKDDESWEDYQKRLVSESKEFYSKKAVRDAELKSKSAQVTNLRNVDPLYNSTASMINDQLHKGVMPRILQQRIDSDPDSFLYVYDINRRLAFFNTLCTKLQDQGKLDDFLSVMKEGQEPSKDNKTERVVPLGSAKKKVTKVDGKPEKKLGNPKRVKSTPPGKPKGTSKKQRVTSTSVGKINWGSKDQIKKLTPQEVLALADEIK